MANLAKVWDGEVGAERELGQNVRSQSLHARGVFYTNTPPFKIIHLFILRWKSVCTQPKKKKKHLKVSVLTENLENNAMEETNKAGK